MKNKSVKYILLSVTITSSLFFTACGHKHTFTEATCTTPMTCTECGLTEGNPVEHQFTEATCTTPKTCSVCSTTEGNPVEHQWSEATCTTPKTCSVCSTTEGKRVEHDWQEATTEVPKTCSLCGLTAGKPLIDGSAILAAHNIDVSQYKPETQESINELTEYFEEGYYTEEDYLFMVEATIDYEINPPSNIIELSPEAQARINANNTDNLPISDTRTDIKYGQGDYSGLEHYHVN